MGYRKLPKPEGVKDWPEDQNGWPENNAYVTTSNSRIVVLNGTKARIAIPCWYYDWEQTKHGCHDYHMHNYIWWPNPDKPDGSIAPPPHHHHHHNDHHKFMPLDQDKLVPIKLIEEGYVDVTVSHDELDGFDIYGLIDTEEENVIRLFVDAQCPDAVDNEVTIRYAVRITNADLDKVDTVLNGEVVIRPAIIN